MAVDGYPKKRYHGIMRSDYIKSENYGKLFVFMQYANVLAVRVSLETGMRIGDVVALKAADLRGRTITFTAHKTGKCGKVVISQDLAQRLKSYAGDGEYIFPHRSDASKHRSRTTVWRDVKRAAEKLRAVGVIGSENVSPHSARKTYAVEDAEKHGIEHTRKQLQHRDISVTKQYAFSDRYIYGDTWTARQIELIFRKLDLIEQMLTEKDGREP